MRRLSQLGAAIASAAVGLSLAWFLSACGQATVQAQPQLEQQAETGQMAPSGARQFLGSDASLLAPGSEGQAALVYFNPSIQPKSYSKILLEPVEFWDSHDSTVSQSDQQMLCSYFYNKLKEALSAKNIPLVNQPGPGVIRIRVAIINATSATPGLRSLSVVIPQARILNYAQSLGTGKAAFAGSAEAAFKATDSVTGQLVAEAVDKRIGGMGLSAAAGLQWADAENAMDYWAQKIADRTAEKLQIGSQGQASS
jgi:hypothetical protein